MITNGAGIGDLGFGWRSIGRGFKAVGKGAAAVGKGTYRLAALPTKAALRVANATSNVLCKGGDPKGTSSEAATARSFCRAVRVKDQVTTRRLLPAAAQIASKAAGASKAYQVARRGAGHFNTAQQIYQAAKSPPAAPMSAADEADMQLIMGLDGADPDELAFALAGVDPNEIGMAMTKSDMLMLAPATVAVVAGLWMALRG